MKKDNYEELAKEIATKAHIGQVDKAGVPYILHPQTVASMVETDEEKAVAWLHDTIEDTKVTLKQLAQVFPKEICDAVDAMTHRKNETYENYIMRIKKNKLASAVKLADLTHNMDLSRLLHVTEKDLKRVEKYKRAKEMLR